MQKFFQELKRRNVFRIGFAYIVLAWTLAQVAELVLDTFDAPAWVMRSVLLLLALGLPVALSLAWTFEITPDGIRLDEEVDRSAAREVYSGRKFDFVIITILVIALSYFVIDKVRQGPDVIGSIAVLPFVNRSVTDDTLYFVDGVHDDLLTQLARIDDLNVISRTSVLEYRDTTKNMREIGRELGVETLLEGAVQRSGNRVRITAQLIRASTDEHLWAKSFDRELTPENVLDIQTEIARAIAVELAATLVPATGDGTLDRAPTQNQEAYDLYLQARAIPFDGSEEELWRGIELARKAVELDPKFALAMGQVASNYLNIYWFTSQRAEHRDAAQFWLDRALALSPDDPRLQLILGELLYTGFLDYDAALAALDRAQRGMPGDARVYLNRGAILRRSGDIQGAMEAFEKAQVLDPRDVFTAAHHIFTFLYTGDVYGARRQGARVRSLPGATPIHLSFTHYVDLFLLGNTKPLTSFLANYAEIDFSSDNYLRVHVPFLERRYDDALTALDSMPDPVVGQHVLWTHSSIRARVFHAKGQLDASRAQAQLAIAELDQIARTISDNPRPVATRALMYAILGQGREAREDIRLATDLYPVEIDPLDGPNYVADGLRALAFFADTEELAEALGGYLSLPQKFYYADYLLLDPAFDRHREHPAIKALHARHSLRDLTELH